MRHTSFSIKVLGIGLIIGGVGIGLLVGGILQAQGPPVLREEVIPKVDVVNLFCIGNDADPGVFLVEAISSTVPPLIDNLKSDCAAELQDLLSRGFGIEPGGGGGVGVAGGENEDIGITYTLTRPMATRQLSTEG